MSRNQGEAGTNGFEIKQRTDGFMAPPELYNDQNRNVDVTDAMAAGARAYYIPVDFETYQKWAHFTNGNSFLICNFLVATVILSL